MARLSVGKAWEEAVPFVRREAHLMLPVALLFLAVPVAIFNQMLPADLLTAMTSANGRLPPLPNSILLAAPIMLLLLQAGALALLALALKPGISVSEALNLAVRRLPIMVCAWLMLFAAMFAFAVVISIAGSLIGLIGGAALGAKLALLVIIAAVAYCGVRMTLLNAVVADGTLGPLASLKASWGLTRGDFWRLFAFFVLSFLVGEILGLALGSVFGIAGGLLGGRTIAVLLSSLVGTLIQSGVQLYVLTMMARLYRQAGS